MTDYMQVPNEEQRAASINRNSVVSVIEENEKSVSRNNSQVSHRFEDMATGLKSGYKCLGCYVSGNALSLLTAAFLFALITSVQYFYALSANSLALQADCVSMAVDSLSFLGNLFAECAPNGEHKRVIQLVMSGISHFLLLGFTIYFIMDAIDTLKSEDADDVDWFIVFVFALGGLLFDTITIVVYTCFGEKTKKKEECDEEEPNPLEPDDNTELTQKIAEPADALTCGINTNMCAALLHVISDLGRSTTTLIESLVIHFLHVPGNKADGVSALIICSVIVIGSVSACIVWMREVYVYITTPAPTTSDYQRMSTN